MSPSMPSFTVFSRQPAFTATSAVKLKRAMLRSSPRLRLAGALTLMLSLSACSGDDDDHLPESQFGPEMRPGQNCLKSGCHGPTSPQGPVWSAAGTIYPSPDAAETEGVPGVQVIFRDSSGAELLRLLSNQAGNFYTSEKLPSGYTVELEKDGATWAMPCSPPAGSCASCHDANTPVAGAIGRITEPGAITDAHRQATCSF